MGLSVTLGHYRAPCSGFCDAGHSPFLDLVLVSYVGVFFL